MTDYFNLHVEVDTCSLSGREAIESVQAFNNAVRAAANKHLKASIIDIKSCITSQSRFPNVR